MTLDFNENISRRLRETRKRLGYTQSQLGERADISMQYVAELEHGRKSMSVVTLAKLADALCVSADYLLWGKEEDDAALIKAQLATIEAAYMQDALELIHVFARAVNRKMR